MLQPFLYCLYDFNASGFFSGNKRKMSLSMPFHQVEGIATSNGLKYYLTNEYISQPPFLTILPKLHTIDLGTYLSPYLNTLTSTATVAQIYVKPQVFPVPSTGNLNIRLEPFSNSDNYILTDVSGKLILSGSLQPGMNTINTSFFERGVYILRIGPRYSELITIM